MNREASQKNICLTVANMPIMNGLSTGRNSSFLGEYIYDGKFE